MSQFVRRFRLTAGLTAGAIVLASVAVVAMLFVIAPRHNVGDAILVVAIVVLCAAIAGSAVGSVRRAQSLKAVSELHPDGLVFLARRQPSLVSDVSVYLAQRQVEADVADRWLAALVDERGISVWSAGPRPAELLLMPWADLSSIEVTDLDHGVRGKGIEIDVRPFETPLIASIGYAAFGLTSTLDRAGVAEVVARTNGLRP